MKKSRRFKTYLCLVVGLLSACTPAAPRHPGDICSIFREKRSWYHAAIKKQKKWQIPLSVPMSIMYQESGFHSNLHTARTYLLWIIPWGHISSAYGYPQAQEGIWRDYESALGSHASRENFSDALDFINWYMTNTRHINGIPVNNGYAHYLAYHEGWGGYRHRSYKRKAWLRSVAHRVGRRAKIYAAQFARCQNDLKDRGFWHWLF